MNCSLASLRQAPGELLTVATDQGAGHLMVEKVTAVDLGMEVPAGRHAVIFRLRSSTFRRGSVGLRPRVAGGVLGAGTISSG